MLKKEFVVSVIVTAGMQVQHEEAGLNSVDALNGSGYLSSSNLTTPELLSSVFSGSGSTWAANPPGSSTSLATEPRLPLLSGGRQAGIFQFPDSNSSSVESTREREYSNPPYSPIPAGDHQCP